MVVKTYYDDGHFDCFDTTQLVDPSLFCSNRLTNWSLDLDVEGDGPILLNMYWYDSAGDEPGPAGLPIAYRRDGWSFVVADTEDRKHLLRMTVDGEPALVRAGDGLVDCNRLDYVADLADHIIPRASRDIEFLEETRDGESGVFSTESTASTLGMSVNVYRSIREFASLIAEAAGDSSEDRFEGN